MSDSFVAAVVVIHSLLAQLGDGGELEKLQGSWVGTNLPIGVTIDGSKGTIPMPTTPAGAKPIRFEISSAKAGLPNSTLEIVVTDPEELPDGLLPEPVPRILVAYRIFDDEIAAVLLPIPEEGTPDAFDPKTIDLADETKPAWARIRLKKVPPEQVAGLAELQGAWTWTDAPASSGGLLNFDFRGTIVDVHASIATISIIDRSTGHLVPYKGARIVLDPDAKRATLHTYALGGEPAEAVTFKYAMTTANSFTTEVVGHEGISLSFVRSAPEELAPVGFAEQALASLQGSWTVSRRWERRGGSDLLYAGKSDETWTVEDRRLTIDVDGAKTDFLIEQTGDLQVIRIVAADDPTNVRQIGRFEAAGDVLRIRLHLTIVPTEPPIAIAESDARVRTKLYQLERAEKP